MSLALALVAPPPMYDVSLPANYAQAKGTLSDAGDVIRQVVANQPAQKTIAQVLTAQTLKDLGDGWSLIFTTVADDPNEPAPMDTRILWEPRGTLTIAFSGTQASPAVCSGLEDLYRVAAWWEVIQGATGTESVEMIESRFTTLLVDMANHSSYGAIEGRINEAAVSLFTSLFQFKNDREPLFNELDIRWGAAASCLTELGRRYRNEG